MIVSKYTNNKGEECVSIIVSKTELSNTKNPNCYRITLSSTYEIHLDMKKKATIKDVFNMKKLINNTNK